MGLNCTMSSTCTVRFKKTSRERAVQRTSCSRSPPVLTPVKFSPFSKPVYTNPLYGAGQSARNSVIRKVCLKAEGKAAATKHTCTCIYLYPYLLHSVCKSAFLALLRTVSGSLRDRCLPGLAFSLFSSFTVSRCSVLTFLGLLRKPAFNYIKLFNLLSQLSRVGIQVYTHIHSVLYILPGMWIKLAILQVIQLIYNPYCLACD